MQQHGKTQDPVRPRIHDGENYVLSDIIGMVGIILRCLHTPVKLGQNNSGNAAFIGHPQHLRMRGRQRLFQFSGNSLGTDPGERRRKHFHGTQCILFHCIPQLGCKAHCAHDPQGVLPEALHGISDGTYDSVLQVPESSEIILQALCLAVSHGIDGKISALQVFFEARGESYFRGMSAIQIFTVHSVGRHLERLPVLQNRHRPVLEAGIDGAAEQGFDLQRKRRSRNVPIIGIPSEQTVPHTPADHIGFIAVVFKNAQDLCRSVRNPNLYIVHKNTISRYLFTVIPELCVTDRISSKQVDAPLREDTGINRTCPSRPSSLRVCRSTRRCC